MARLYYNLFLFLSIKSLNHANGQIKGMFFNATAPMNYSTAVSYCSDMGMTLPSTLSETEHTALVQLMNTINTQKVWLSMRRDITGEWLSVNGSKEGSVPGVPFPSNNETGNKRCLAIRKHDTRALQAVQCFYHVTGALCYKRECRTCLPWNCARLEEGCIWVTFNVPNWYIGRSECRLAGGDLWTLSDAWKNSFSKLKVKQDNDFWVGWRKNDWVIETAEKGSIYPMENYFENDKAAGFSCAVILLSGHLKWKMHNCSLPAATVCQVNGSISRHDGKVEQGNSSDYSACQCPTRQCEKRAVKPCPGTEMNYTLRHIMVKQSKIWEICSMMLTVLLGCLCPLIVILLTFGFYLCIRKRAKLREVTERYTERLHQSRIMEQLYDTLTFSRDRSKSNAAQSSVEEMTNEMPVYAVVRKKSKKEETPGSGFHCTTVCVEDDPDGTEVRKREKEKDSLVSERDKYGTYINLEE